IPADCPTTIVGLDDLDTKEPYFHIYPNPASNQFTVSGELNLHQIEILNSAGQILQKISPNANLHTIDISALPSGLYFVKIAALDSKSAEMHKIVKE
ncbi:MAG: T9SS type A sorting domain-containing protein, partial [Saprospiraceae bacterium]|nr:T9SS type A sorting domain-containing protein [Saprospiraceae bacterium]